MEGKLKRNIIILFCFAFVLGIATYILLPKQKIITVGGLIGYESKTDLINDASVIVHGTVKDILPGKWSNPNFKKGKNVRNIIQTDVIVDVVDVYKGTPYDNKSVTVRVDTGEVGNVKMVSDVYANFNTGEEVILFLSKDDGDLANTGENYYVVTGMCQGKFTLTETVSSADFSESVNGNAKIFKNAHDKATLNLSSVKEEIDTTLKELEKNPLPRQSKEEIRKNNEKLFGK